MEMPFVVGAVPATEDIELVVPPAADAKVMARLMDSKRTGLYVWAAIPFGLSEVPSLV
jgi:hypothetical protein